jgi:TIR domain
MSDWTRVDPGPSQVILDQLSGDAGQCDLTAEETDVDCRSLTFYRRYKLYRLINRATLPAFSMHYLGDGEHFFALNGTANPIYTASEQDPLQLAEGSVILYVEFFFSHVQGSEGEVFFVKDPRRTPLLAALDDDQRATLLAEHRPLTLQYDSATGEFLVHGTLHYGGGLINASVAVDPTGKISFHEMSIVLTLAKAPDFYSCFISHSFADEQFALKLSKALAGKGVTTWLSQKDVLGGRKLHEQLKAGIRQMDKLLLVLSDTSIKSNWVSTEVLEARQRERMERTSLLFPIRIVDYAKLAELELFDADEGRDLGREIRQFFINDFSGWRDDALFEAELHQLLQALKRPAWQMTGPQ